MPNHKNLMLFRCTRLAAWPPAVALERLMSPIAPAWYPPALYRLLRYPGASKMAQGISIYTPESPPKTAKELIVQTGIKI